MPVFDFEKQITIKSSLSIYTITTCKEQNERDQKRKNKQVCCWRNKTGEKFLPKKESDGRPRAIARERPELTHCESRREAGRANAEAMTAIPFPL